MKLDRIVIVRPLSRSSASVSHVGEQAGTLAGPWNLSTAIINVMN